MEKATKKAGVLAVLILVLASVVLLSGCSYIFGQKHENNATDSAGSSLKDEVESVVSDFITNFLASAPGPNSEDQVNGVEAKKALGALTAEAQKMVNNNSPNSISGGLAFLCGVQDIPPGFEITSSTKVDEYAVEVVTKWNFTMDPVTKTFTLLHQDGQWKINKVR